MNDYDQDDALEATDDQIRLLRELGVSEAELEDISFAAAEDWITELRAMREGAEQIGRE